MRLQESPYKIKFTQYLRPHGRQQTVEFDAAPDMYLRAQKIIGLGAKFEAEILTTNEVSLTVNHNGEDIAIEVVPNGPGVVEAVGRLIKNTEDVLL